MNNNNWRKPDWEKWFAWHPVVVRGHMTWLKVVERKWIIDDFPIIIWGSEFWVYREIQ